MLEPTNVRSDFRTVWSLTKLALSRLIVGETEMEQREVWMRCFAIPKKDSRDIMQMLFRIEQLI